MYELKEINNSIKEKIISLDDDDVNISIKADTISMNSILKTSHPINFNSELNKVFGSTKTEYPKGTHKSEKQNLY